MSCYQKAIEINPRIVGAHNNMGLIYRNLNDLENAVKSYQSAIKIQPNHGGAFHNLALAYKEPLTHNLFWLSIHYPLWCTIFKQTPPH